MKNNSFITFPQEKKRVEQIIGIKLFIKIVFKTFKNADGKVDGRAHCKAFLNL